LILSAEFKNNYFSGKALSFGMEGLPVSKNLCEIPIGGLGLTMRWQGPTIDLHTSLTPAHCKPVGSGVSVSGNIALHFVPQSLIVRIEEFYQSERNPELGKNAAYPPL
jgi:hypothetical protein